MLEFRSAHFGVLGLVVIFLFPPHPHPFSLYRPLDYATTTNYPITQPLESIVDQWEWFAIVTWSHAFSRVWRLLRVFLSSFHWFIVLFGFTTQVGGNLNFLIWLIYTPDISRKEQDESGIQNNGWVYKHRIILLWVIWDNLAEKSKKSLIVN